MINLLRIEFLRHRMLAAGFALLQLAVLYYLGTLGQQIHAMPTFAIWLMAQMVLGAAFGVYQIGLHKRSNDWLYLLHRPLGTGRILAALLLAGAAVCLIVTVVPALLMLLALQRNGMNGIEARHFIIPLFAGGAALSSYFCGCFAQLGSNRLSVLALALPLAFAGYVSNTTHPLLAVLVLLWSLALAVVSFRPDLAQLPRRAWAWPLTELPIQYGCLWLIVTAIALVQEMNGLLTNSDGNLHPAAGTDLQVQQLPIPELMQFGLQHSTHPDAAFLARQVPLGEYAAARNFRLESRPQGQLPLAYSNLQLRDPERNHVWTFRYSVGLYLGYDSDSRAQIGWLGPDGFSFDTVPPTKRFTDAPASDGNDFLIDADQLYLIDWEAQRLQLRYRHPQGERFTDSLGVSENVTTLLSDTQLFVFSSAHLREQSVPLQPRAVLTLPGNDNPSARRISVLELIDGYLVAALTDLPPTTIAPDFALFGHAQLQLFRTRGAQHGEVIAQLALPSGVSTAYIYGELVAAPGMRLLSDAAWGLARNKSAERTFPLPLVPIPAQVWLLTALVCALSAALTAWLLRNRNVPRSTLMFWITCNALMGCTGLLSFLLGYYWRRLDRLQPAQGSNL